MTLVFILLFFFYLLFVAMLIVGWNQYHKSKVPKGQEFESLISVIVPARNEGAGIKFLLEDIRRQSYQNFEVIVVDDHSGDNTSDAVVPFIHSDSRFILIRNDGEGKKAALTTGVRASKGAIIVTTDADCRVKEQWLRTISSYFQSVGTQFVFGSVKLAGSSFFARMQAHEFLSLVGTAASTAWWGFPTMCNGANLAFRKAVFDEVGGYSDNFHIPSGDDEFLMHKIFHKYPEGIQFVYDRQAVVQTSAVSFKGFMRQRVRWAGKWRHNLSVWNVMLAVFIFIFHVSVIALPLAMYAGWINVVAGLSLLIFKAAVEGVFLKKIAVFFNVPWNWGVFLLLQTVYSFYAVSIGAVSTFIPIEWKGRNLKSLALSAVKK